MVEPPQVGQQVLKPHQSSSGAWSPKCPPRKLLPASAPVPNPQCLVGGELAAHTAASWADTSGHGAGVWASPCVWVSWGLLAWDIGGSSVGCAGVSLSSVPWGACSCTPLLHLRAAKLGQPAG